MPRKANGAKVVIYVAAGSERCRRTMEYLVSRGIRFAVKDVLESERSMKELALLTGGRAPVPVVVMGTRVFLAPSCRVLRDALKKLRG